MLKLSVLDQSPIRKGGTAKQAIRETIELIRFVDRLGYHRFWVSEHHNILGLAGSSPEVLIAHLAGETNRIRVGSGGVMLPNHSSLKVAENFRMLETLFPGRIDLGVGRAPGGDRLTAAILNPGNSFIQNDFVQQLIDLKHFLTDTIEPDSIQAKVRAIPIAETVPELWILTSSGESGLLAAHFGMALSFAHFINPNGGRQAMHAYREKFQQSEALKNPKGSVGIFVLCSDTEEKANELRAVMDRQLLNIEKGISEGIVSYDEIKSQRYADAEEYRIAYNRGRMVTGTPDQVKVKLLQLAKEYQVDEIVVTTITHDFGDRLRSYQLLAEAFELEK
ncbi:luciferase family oxidoreductase, group 1 [Leptospira inadai serovar Lyme str. 10]|uniref:Luciferase-like monooxygenase n=2 Tax=Leptospira inadai serovar Lyme TaxID=293084 RepID=V6HQP4_9LEPT|nr:LLM class flavin-dependent oxidoreductase [Leptospira inadai]EQA34794.1 luciferase family oxidoreductase, group 1 [Leptospira inadai serovar Lyme str. 10]PNV75886.1 LLM class flavin-dependent oxidoreductase [Leptospira inadai serovar Lyme]